MREYDDIVEWQVANRRPEIGVSEVARFARPLAAGSHVLDLGCGDGIPISRLLLQSGLDLHAIDSSAKMIERFRANFPNVPAQCATIQDSDFFRITFDAVVAWGVLFHLPAAGQEEAIAKVARHLRCGGRFLFTSGDEPGTAERTIEGVSFRYTSLGVDAYSAALRKNGLALLDRHTDAWGNCYYVSEKPPTVAGG